jgi:hypothetical protein
MIMLIYDNKVILPTHLANQVCILYIYLHYILYYTHIYLYYIHIYLYYTLYYIHTCLYYTILYTLPARGLQYAQDGQQQVQASLAEAGGVLAHHQLVQAVGCGYMMYIGMNMCVNTV